MNPIRLCQSAALKIVRRSEDGLPPKRPSNLKPGRVRKCPTISTLLGTNPNVETGIFVATRIQTNSRSLDDSLAPSPKQMIFTAKQYLGHFPFVALRLAHVLLGALNR